MTDAAGVARVRISKVRFHDGRELVILPESKTDQDSIFIATLVRILAAARNGKVMAYCGGVVIDEGDRVRSLEFGASEDNLYRLELVGLIEGVKQRVISQLVIEASDV